MRLLPLILFAVVAFAKPTENVPVKVRLDEAKRYAVEHNFEVQAFRQEYEEKEAAKGKSKAAFFPSLGLGAGGDSSQGGQTAAMGYLYTNYNLFRGFADTYGAQLTAVDAEVAQIKMRQAEFRVGLAVEEKFNLYLLKKELIELKNEALKLNETHKAQAARRQGAGLAAGSDVMEFDLRDSLLRSDLVLLSQELEEVRIQLKVLLGEQIGGNIEPVGGLPHQHLKETLMDYLKTLHDSCEEIKLANRELAKANVEAKLWRSNWLPRMDLQAQVGYLGVDNRPPNGGVGFNGRAVVTWDIFTGFSSYWEKREGEAKRLKSEANLKRVIQQAVSDTETAFRRLKTIQDRVDIEEKNENRGKRYYDAVMGEYRRGVKNSADVKVAAEVYYDTRARRANYKYDFLKERLDLERAIGKPIAVEVHAEEK